MPDTGNSVQLVNVPLVGVPRTGVTNVGVLANTRAPVPVSSVKADARLAELGVAKKVATPVPRPLIPVDTGSPVALVNVTLEGVPSTGVTNVGLLANTRAPVPVSSVTAEAKLAELGVARNVATPVPKPLIPVDTGNPVQLVNVPELGVPSTGVVKVGDVNVLLVSVCVVSVPTIVVVASGNVMVLSAVGSATVSVVSNASAVAPSNTMLASFKVNPVTTGLVIVLLVNVSVEEVVTTLTPSIATTPAETLESVVSVACPSSTEPTPKAVEVDAVNPLIGKSVQLVSVPELGVPNTGVVNVGLVSVLLVNVSVVARPTKVSDDVGNVNVPVLLILLMTGNVSVLLVNVSVVARPTNVSDDVGNVNTPVLLMLEMTGNVSVLLVNVSVVARPTNVSVDVGKVNVPVLVMLLMTGVVSVLLVSVSAPVSVAKLSSVKAELNSATVPDTVLLPRAIVLLDSVCVPEVVTKGTSAPVNPACQLSAVSFQIKEALVEVPRSTSMPAFCDGVPASSAFNRMVLSPKVTVLDVTEVVAPFTVKLPEMVTSAPDMVMAVVGVAPDLMTSSPPDCDKLPNVVPPSFNNTSAPSASRTMSPAASTVKSAEAFTCAMVGVVNVLLVSVSEPAKVAKSPSLKAVLN